MSDGSEIPPSSIPCATIAPRRQFRRNLWWLIPVICGIVTLGLFYYSQEGSGQRITIEFLDGHGIKPDDLLKHKGIIVGQVERVAFTEDLSKVLATVRLAPFASPLAREGSRFWVVRPQISLDAIGGLETIVGAKYIAVEPGPMEGAHANHFIGLHDPPVVAPIPGSLEVILESSHRHGLSPSAPILYRGYRVGCIVEIGLASDARSVRARCAIDPDYRELVRSNTKFWNHSGWRLNVGFTGIQLDADTLPQLMSGSVEMGTPDNSGEPVRTGHNFILYDHPEEDWLKWSPSMGYGTGWSERSTGIPQPLRIALRWQERRFGFRTDMQRVGWCLPVSESEVICLRDQVIVGDRALEGSASIELAGLAVPPDEFQIPDSVSEEDAESVIRIQLPVTIPDTVRIWSMSPGKVAIDPNEVRGVVIVQERAQSSIRIDGSRLQADGKRWKIDKSVVLPVEMDGLPVLDAESNQVIGLLSVAGGEAAIAILP